MPVGHARVTLLNTTVITIVVPSYTKKLSNQHILVITEVAMLYMGHMITANCPLAHAQREILIKGGGMKIE